MSYVPPEKLAAAAKEELARVSELSELKPKDRMTIPVQEMPAQDPDVRRSNMQEVALGYTPEQAKLEAMRCLQCKNAPCVKGCPVSINIPGFIQAIVDGDNKQAVDIIKETSLLPQVCGRVCPQESQCQKPCTVGKALKSVDKAVAIGRLERYVADWERENHLVEVPEIKPATGKKVAVIGSGPASITTAADVRREGHEVTVFEAFHKPGGVLLYGIPEFRLPKEIVQAEIDGLKAMDVEVKTNFVIGRTRKINDLIEKDGYDAVFIGAGAGLPKFMGIEGENLVGVFSANEYLTRSNLMKAYDQKRAATPMFQSKKVAILGGGNVAMDAARTAMRLGAESVCVIYRRSEAELPARAEEIEHAKEEGIQFHFLNNVKRILGDEKGWVRAAECVRFELGEPDESGRRRPIEIPNSEFELELDTIIVAIGSGSNPLIKQTSEGIEFTERGNIVVNESGRSSHPRVFAGGDIVLGAATVIMAMGEGRRAAKAINEMLAAEA
ncbi:NADPH-dependent glutamate synthase [Verrucomicrobiota bacterium]